MNKRFFMFLSGILLTLFIASVLWWLYKSEQASMLTVESYVPANVEALYRINREDYETFFLSSSIATTDPSKMLINVVDSLIAKKIVNCLSQLFVTRMEEGKNKILYIANQLEGVTDADVKRVVSELFYGHIAGEEQIGRKKIYSWEVMSGAIYLFDAGTTLLLSDSRDLLKDAFNYSRSQRGSLKEERSLFSRIDHYLSRGAAGNIFLSDSFFKHRLESSSFLSVGLPFATFGWAALDINFREDGILLNGFLHYTDEELSLPKVLKSQEPRRGSLDRILPGATKHALLLNISDIDSYFTVLEDFYEERGRGEIAKKRILELRGVLGNEFDKEIKELWDGEIAKGVLNYNHSKGGEDGVVVIGLKSGTIGETVLQKMVKEYARQSKTTVKSLEHSYLPDREEREVYYKFPISDFCSIIWGDLFTGLSIDYIFVRDNYLVMASSESAIQRFFRDYIRKSGLSETSWYRCQQEKLSTKYNLMQLSHCLYLRELLGEGEVESKMDMPRCSSIGLQWTNEGDRCYTTAFVATDNVEEESAAPVVWQTRLDANITLKPAIVLNHNTREQEILVQDSRNNLYLINDIGRVLWKLSLPRAINSEIYQIDLYKNGKLQYLFSTATHLYIVDRDGNYLPRYPLALKSHCEVGITLFDYDNNRNYRIFAPGVDQQIYLYEAGGDPVKGWGMPKSDNPILSRLQHFRVNNKDYLVYVDKYRIYILDRRGNIRVKANKLFDLLPGTDLALTNIIRGSGISFLDANKECVTVGFDGSVTRWQSDRISPEAKYRFGDVTGDGVDELVVTQENELLVFNGKGEIIYEEQWEDIRPGEPFIYNFGTKDIRIGFADQQQCNLMLLDIKGNSKGFPLKGETPFSIIFLPNREEGYYLFTGHGDLLLKYRLL